LLSLASILLLAIFPIPIIYFFYHRYFIVKPSYLFHLEYYIYGMMAALLILLFGKTLAPPSFPLLSAAAGGFLYAALVEKAASFIFILILMYQSKSILMVLNSVISAMLFGLGFSTVENILYSFAVHKSIIVVRLFSSVPVHVLTCGIIGYYLALMRLSGSRIDKVRHVLKALFIPICFHGLYDTLLFTGGAGTFWIAPLIIVLILIMEYTLAKSQTLPMRDGLRKHSLFLEDWMSIQRQPQYERWILRSMGSKNREQVPLLHLRLSAYKISIIIMLIIIALLSLPSRDVIINALGHKLSRDEIFMLFTLLPVLYSLNLLAIGVINPKYFLNSIIKIPIIIDVNVSINDEIINTVTYHVSGNYCYLKTVDRFMPGTGCSLIFQCPDFTSPMIEGTVIWDIHDEQKQLSGSLVRFVRKPFAFWIFLLKYSLYRISKGLFFNLQLPGFRSIRQLFVRPVSVMQKERRFNAGHTVFEQGEEGSVFYLIKKGEVDIFKTLNTGERMLMATLSEGDVFGEMAIVGDQPRLATAICRTNCLLAAAEADNLAALIEGNPVFAQRLIKNFANRLLESENLMIKNISEAGDESKKREQKIATLCKFILCIAGMHDRIPRDINDSHLETLSRQFNMDKKTVRDLIDILNNSKNGDRLDDAVESCVNKI
jgi:CRP-like cAMP-binding protein/RsiW-degrading membrane proteinase PrsW (M82 family)